MSGGSLARDSSLARTRRGSRPKSAQVWSKVNSPPVPSNAQRYAAIWRRRSSAALRFRGVVRAIPYRLWSRDSLPRWALVRTRTSMQNRLQPVSHSSVMFWSSYSFTATAIIYFLGASQ